MAARTPEDVAKLPKWAQARIARLENSVEHLNARLAQGPADSRAFADPYSDSPHPLGPDPHVRFIVGAPRHAGGRPPHISVRLADGGLYVMASDGLTIEPQSSNTCRIFNVDPHQRRTAS